MRAGNGKRREIAWRSAEKTSAVGLDIPGTGLFDDLAEPPSRRAAEPPSRRAAEPRHLRPGVGHERFGMGPLPSAGLLV